MTDDNTVDSQQLTGDREQRNNMTSASPSRQDPVAKKPAEPDYQEELDMLEVMRL